MSEATKIAAMPTRSTSKPLKECQTLGDALNTTEFKRLVAESVPKHVSGDRMLRTFNQAVSKSPDLLKCSMRSVIGQFLTLSQLGFEPNTPLGHAYLIPFKAKVWNRETRRMDEGGYEANLILGYQGLLDLSYRSATLTGMHCDVAWAKDDFSFEYGTDAHLKHRPRGVRAQGEQPEYAYMHAKLRDGQAFEVLPYSEVLRIRNLSQGYRAALAAKEGAEAKGWQPPKAWTEAPWVKHEIAMARKTALRHGSKWLPRSVELAGALALDEAADRKTIDYSDVFQAAAIDQESDYLGVAADVAEANGDAGAAFGVRERQEGPAATQGQSQAEPAAAAPSAVQGRQEPQQQPFEAYLIGEDGEVADDLFLNPEAFMRAVMQLAGNDAASRQAVLEHNADAIEEACRLSQAAAGLYAGWSREDAPAGDAAAAFPELAVADVRGKPDWIGYVREIKDRIAAAPGNRVAALAEHHKPTWQGAPPAQRMLIVKAIAERCNAAGVALPEWLPAMMTAKAAAVPAQQQGMALGEPQEAKRAEPDAAAIEAYCKRSAEGLLKLTTAEQLTAWLADPVTRERRDALRQNWPQHSEYLERAIADAHQRLKRPEDAS